MPRRDHAGPHHPFGPVIEAQHDVGIVINLATWHNTGQLGGYCAYFQAGDKASQVMSMCSQITNHTGFPSNAGSGTPDSLLMSFGFQQGRSPTRGMLHLHEPDCAQFPVANHLASLAYHWIAAIAVGYTENQATLAYQAHQFKSLLYIDGQGFVTNDIHTLLQKGFGNSVVAVVGGHNANR